MKVVLGCGASGAFGVVALAGGLAAIAMAVRRLDLVFNLIESLPGRVITVTPIERNLLLFGLGSSLLGATLVTTTCTSWGAYQAHGAIFH